MPTPLDPTPMGILGGFRRGLGFQLEAVGFHVRFKGSGFTLCGLLFRVWGLGFRLWGLGFGVVWVPGQRKAFAMRQFMRQPKNMWLHSGTPSIIPLKPERISKNHP